MLGLVSETKMRKLPKSSMNYSFENTLVGSSMTMEATPQWSETQTQIGFEGLGENVVKLKIQFLEIRNHTGKREFIATGMLRCMVLENQTTKWIIQTAAHNFIHIFNDGFTEPEEAIGAYAFICCSDSDSYLHCFDIDKWTCHPKYDGTPSCGYDFAFAAINNKNIDLSFCQCTWSSVSTNYLSGGDEIQITGYSKDKEGLWTSMGEIIRVVEPENEAGAKLLHYRAETSPGQRGSPILLVPPYNDKITTLLEKNRTAHYPDYICIGVHLEGNRFATSNVGTAYTETLEVWGAAAVKQFWNSDRAFDNMDRNQNLNMKVKHENVSTVLESQQHCQPNFSEATVDPATTPSPLLCPPPASVNGIKRKSHHCLNDPYSPENNCERETEFPTSTVPNVVH